MPLRIFGIARDASRPRSARRMRFGIAGVSVVTTLVLGLGVASAATPPGNLPKASQCQSGERLLKILQVLPADLEAALKHLTTLPKVARVAAVQAVRSQALVGAYGADIQKRAESTDGRTIMAWADVPPALRADLKATKALAPADRSARVKVIGKKAIIGGYGDTVKVAAKKAQTSDFWSKCVTH